MNKEQKYISAINHDKAEQYFIENGLMPSKENRTCKWVLHHIDPSWKENDLDRYIQWNVEDLAPMTQSDHNRIHNKERVGEKNPNYGKTRSEEHRKKLSKSLLGKNKGKPSPFKGKHHSEESKQKISKSHEGKQNWARGLTKDTDERIAKISKSLTGHECSEETRKKMSEAKKGKPAWNKGMTKTEIQNYLLERTK